MPGYPVVLTINAPVTHRPFGELMGTVEINNSGSNGWIVINGQYMAGPYQQNVVSLQSPGTSFDLQLTSAAAPGQTNPGSPAGTAVVHFYPFQPAQGGPEAPPANPGVIVGGTGWGAGSPGNALKALTAGQSFTIDQVNQLINLLTGAMTGQAVTINNLVNEGSLQVSGHFTPGSGAGAEIVNNGGIATLQGFDRTNVAWLPVQVAGSEIDLQFEGVTVLAITSLLAAITGLMTATSLKASGNIPPAAGTGPGAEILVAGGAALFQGFNRTASTFIPVTLTGSQLGVSINGATTLVPHHFEAGTATGSGTVDTTVNFQNAFSATPTCVLTVLGDQAANNRVCAITAIGTTSFTFNVRDTVSGNRTAVPVNWMAFQRT